MLLALPKWLKETHFLKQRNPKAYYYELCGGGQILYLSLIFGQWTIFFPYEKDMRVCVVIPISQKTIWKNGRMSLSTFTLTVVFNSISVSTYKAK